jgi:hypothetical protein
LKVSSWLFDTRDIVARADDGQAALTVASGGGDGVMVLLGESVRHLEGCIGALKRDAVVHFVTYGKWSMHQLIIYLLKQIGPAKLYMTSWSLTEQPLRALLNARLQGLQMVEDMGAVLFSPAQVALALGFDVDGFTGLLEDEQGDVYRRYHKGRLLSLYRVRKNIFEMAANGSGPAQQLVQKMAIDYDWKKKAEEA